MKSVTEVAISEDVSISSIRKSLMHPEAQKVLKVPFPEKTYKSTKTNIMLETYKKTDSVLDFFPFYRREIVDQAKTERTTPELLLNRIIKNHFEDQKY
jgi:hypothetical protein